jgi:hypothetical protein
LHGGWGGSAGWYGWNGWNWPSYRWNRSYYSSPSPSTNYYYQPTWSSAGAGTYQYTAGESAGARYVWPNPYYLYYDPKVYNYAPFPDQYSLFRGPTAVVRGQ